MKYFSFLFGACTTLALLLSSQAIAGPSHLGQAIQSHITLTYQGDQNSVCPANPAAGINKRSFYRVFSSGARSNVRFIVPSGKELVITDVTWNAPWFISSSQLTVGDSALLKLAIHNVNGPHRIVIFESTPVVITNENDNARIGTNEFMTTGFRVGQGRILCASVGTRAAGFDAGQFDPSVINLNGYLIDKF